MVLNKSISQEFSFLDSLMWLHIYSGSRVLTITQWSLSDCTYIQRKWAQAAECLLLLFNLLQAPIQAKQLKWNPASFPKRASLVSFLSSIPSTTCLSFCAFDFPSTPRHFWNGLRWEGEIRTTPVKPSTRGSGRNSTQMQLEGLPLHEILFFPNSHLQR
jgi:hypothetical protein